MEPFDDDGTLSGEEDDLEALEAGAPQSSDAPPPQIE